MKKISIISASLLLGSLTLLSCSSNKMAMSNNDDNLYFMASDVKIATQYAVANNNPTTFENLKKDPTAVQENFSSRNVNPEYLSRYQANTNIASSEEGAVYFDDTTPTQNTGVNVNAYDNFYSNNGAQNFNTPNINFNFGLGFGFSPWGWGMSPWMGFGWGYPMGFNMGLGFGWGYPMYPGWGFPMYGWRNPMFGWGYPMYGWGMPVYPVYPGYPSYILPGGEYGNRRVVYGARPTRGSSFTNTGIRAGEAAVMPSTARAQARANAATANSSSPRRVISSSENSRVASRDFSNSQNDYYNSGRSRVATTTRNMNSAASDRGTVSNSRGSSYPSARPSVTSPSNTRGYSSPSRSSYPSGYDRSTNPSYNRSSSPSYNRSTSPSYNRSTSPSYNRSSSPSYNRGTSSPSYNRSVSPSRSYDNSSSFSAPSRMSSGGSSFSAPSRSMGGSSGGGVSGGSRGRGN
ncbi:hypothetical protein DDT91_18635 [Algoriphagus sp. AK58]|nr:hypothetical protein [Algoriphagus sp. AK58]